MGTMMKMLQEDYPEIPLVTLVDPEQFSREDLAPAEQFIYDMLAPYLGYLNGGLTFDTANTEAALADTGLPFPTTGREFLHTLLRYAVGQGYLVLSRSES